MFLLKYDIQYCYMYYKLIYINTRVIHVSMIFNFNYSAHISEKRLSNR